MRIETTLLEHRPLQDPSYYLRILVDRVPSVLAYWDTDLRCRFANRAYERWFGVNADSLIGTSLRDLLGPELFGLNEPYIRGALQGEEQIFERLVPGPGGIKRHSLANYVPDIVEGKVMGFLVQVTEVTKLKEVESRLQAEVLERQHAYDLLRERESALRQAQRLGQIGSWERESATDTATWSEELYRILDCDPRQPPPRGAELAKRFAPQSWASVEAALAHTIETGEPYSLELEYVRQDGSRGWMEARGEAVRNEQAAVLRLRGTAMDVTERHRAEELRLQRDLALAADRNKMLFLSRASHEMRTPLNAILGFAQLIQGDPATSLQHKQWADTILRSGWHLVELVDELLDLSNAELGQIDVQRSPLDLCELIRSSVSQFAPLANKAQVELINEVADDASLQVLGDAKRIRQILNNLLSNAIKYNRAGGTVRLSAVDLGASVEVAVEDTGIGMSADQRSRLFTPFDRLGAEHTAVQGTGLGLALTKKLIEAMGGSLHVESQPAQGSKFVVVFDTGKHSGPLPT